MNPVSTIQFSVEPDLADLASRVVDLAARDLRIAAVLNNQVSRDRILQHALRIGLDHIAARLGKPNPDATHLLADGDPG